MQETPMSPTLPRLLTAGLFLACLGVQAQLADYRGFKDPALFSRLPNYFLSEGGAFVEAQFDTHDFRVVEKNKDESRRIEGHLLKYVYSFDEKRAAAPASPKQIVRNYINAATRLGGKVLYDGGDRCTLMVAKAGQETWVDIEAFGNSYNLLIIERQGMKQDVIADATALKGGLAQDGHVEVPGIFFDFNKSEVKPESGPALKELVKLLKGSPALKVWVVGHTDYVGSPEANLQLSNARAAAVIRSLTQLGVEARRLGAYGAGPYAPVASNRSDPGRARNRRVELVEQP
jgi:outer membrane protein OmpA-like peptidoglycan-associated protein